jgi:hypothetical protein
MSNYWAETAFHPEAPYGFINARLGIMSKGIYLEQRSAQRFKLTNKQLPGVLCIAETGRRIFAMAVDASKFGLCIAACEEISPGTDLVFEIEGTSHSLRVVWNKKRGENVYRHGLEVTDPLQDLEYALFTSGCLEIDLDTIIEFDPLPSTEPDRHRP